MKIKFGVICAVLIVSVMCFFAFGIMNNSVIFQRERIRVVHRVRLDGVFVDLPVLFLDC